MADLTLSQRWMDQYLSGMMLFHTLLGQDAAITPKVQLTLDGLVHTLQEIVSGTYQAIHHFHGGASAALRLTVQPPALMPQTQYALIVLNATTARSNFVSVETGGIAFEDPVWAIFAAHAVSQDWSLAVPRAMHNAALWRNLTFLADAVAKGGYQAKRFLGPIDGFCAPEGTPRFGLLTVDSGQLDALRARGMQALMTAQGPRFYELFQPSPG